MTPNPKVCLVQDGICIQFIYYSSHIIERVIKSLSSDFTLHQLYCCRDSRPQQQTKQWISRTYRRLRATFCCKFWWTSLCNFSLMQQGKKLQVKGQVTSSRHAFKLIDERNSLPNVNLTRFSINCHKETTSTSCPQLLTINLCSYSSSRFRKIKPSFTIEALICQKDQQGISIVILMMVGCSPDRINSELNSFMISVCHCTTACHNSHSARSGTRISPDIYSLIGSARAYHKFSNNIQSIGSGIKHTNPNPRCIIRVVSG